MTLASCPRLPWESLSDLVDPHPLLTVTASSGGVLTQVSVRPVPPLDFQRCCWTVVPGPEPVWTRDEMDIPPTPGEHATPDQCSVDVVVVAYNCTRELHVLLPELLGLAEVGEIVVVDHGDGTAAPLARSLGCTSLWDPTNPGFVAGQNRGASLVQGQALLVLNPDARLEPGALSGGLELLCSDPLVAAVQGVIRSTSSNRPERSAGIALRPFHLVGRALGLKPLTRLSVVDRILNRIPVTRDWVTRVSDDPMAVEALSATALLLRRSAFDAVGGFDESFFLYGEDIDLSRRLRRAGYRLVSLPIPWALHSDGSTSSSWWDRELRWFEGSLRYGQLWWSPIGRVVGILAASVMALRLAVSSPRRSSQAWVVLVARPLRTLVQGHFA